MSSKHSKYGQSSLKVHKNYRNPQAGYKSRDSLAWETLGVTSVTGSERLSTCEWNLGESIKGNIDRPSALIMICIDIVTCI